MLNSVQNGVHEFDCLSLYLDIFSSSLVSNSGFVCAYEPIATLELVCPLYYLIVLKILFSLLYVQL